MLEISLTHAGNFQEETVENTNATLFCSLDKCSASKLPRQLRWQGLNIQIRREHIIPKSLDSSIPVRPSDYSLKVYSNSRAEENYTLPTHGLNPQHTTFFTLHPPYTTLSPTHIPRNMIVLPTKVRYQRLKCVLTNLIPSRTTCTCYTKTKLYSFMKRKR